MSNWHKVDVYSTFMKLSGEIEVVGHERLSDAVNRFSDFLQLRDSKARPLSISYPVLSREESRTTIAKSSVILIVPGEGTKIERTAKNETMWRAKEVQSVGFNTTAFSLEADCHIESKRTLQDHLERYRNDFLPVTGVSALWIPALHAEQTQSLQENFALLNPQSILSFSPRVRQASVF